MKRIIMLLQIIMLALPATAAAQNSPAYHGGSGDGYASATATNIHMGITKDRSEQGFTIYPNPVAKGEIVTFQAPALNNGDLIHLVDAAGKEIEQFSFRRGTNTFSSPTSEGVYFIEIRSRSAVEVEKLVVY